MTREQQGLQSAAGAKIERACCRLANRQPRQGFAGRHRAEHDLCVGARKVTGDEQTLVRTDVIQRPHEPVGDLHQTEINKVRHAECAQRGIGEPPLDRHGVEKQFGDDREWRSVGAGVAARERPRICGSGRCAPARAQAVFSEPGRGEMLREPREPSGIEGEDLQCLRCHEGQSI